jgi:hypothetical protein
MAPDEAKDVLDRKIKRIISLGLTWRNIVNHLSVANKHLFELNPSLTVKVVEHYYSDLTHLKQRYDIRGLAEAPKVAGLMSSAVLKYRPVVPKDCLQWDVEDAEINEVLAVYHGVSICASYNELGKGNAPMAALMAKPYFRKWYSRIIYLVKERNYTSEALIAIFETLCLAAFPDGLVMEAESK